MNISFPFEGRIENPWVLLITIPALILGIIPFLRLNKKRRVSSKHLIPFIIHLTLILVLSTVVAGISYTEHIEEIHYHGNAVIFVVDMSDSNAEMKEEMNQHMTAIMKAAENKEAIYPEESRTKFGLVVFGGSDGVLQNKTEAAKDPTNELAGTIILPGSLSSMDRDILSEYVREDDSNEIRGQSDIRAGIDKATEEFLRKEKANENDYAPSIPVYDEECTKRIILLSDGRENVGNSYYSLQQLTENDISLECAYFNYLESDTKGTEVQIIGLETKGEAIDGKEYDATVTINSTKKKAVKIEIKDIVSGKVLASENVMVSKGISAYKVTFVAEQYDYTNQFAIQPAYLEAFNQIKAEGIQGIKAEVSVRNYFCNKCKDYYTSDELVTGARCPKCKIKTTEEAKDVLSQNNTYYSWYRFKPQGKILIVKGSENQLSQINVAELEEQSGYKIEQCATKDFPKTLQQLLDYDEVILMDVNYSELPKNAGANIKRFVEEVGRGLLFTSGENIYTEKQDEGVKSMADSKTEKEETKGVYVVDPDIADLLPVDLNLEKKQEAIAMVLVVDLSSSMKETVKYSPLICKYCLYEDVDNESPEYCPQCLTAAKFVEPTRYHVALSSVKKVIMGETEVEEDVAENEGATTTPETDRAEGTEEETEEKKTLQDDDLVGVILFNQGCHIALDNAQLGDKENREKLCEKVQKEFEHFYYAHYSQAIVDDDGDVTVEDSEVKINAYDSRTDITDDENYSPIRYEGKTYYWYKVTHTEVKKDEEGNYTGELVSVTENLLMESGNIAPGGDDKATSDKIKSHGTAYTPPMHEASAMLARAVANPKISIQVKQIVFISDGAPNDKGMGYEGIVERLAKSGTRTTAIGIGLGESDTSAIEELNLISTAGKGDTFLVDAAKDLDETLFKITDEISKELRNENIDVEIIADSRDSIIYEGVSDTEGYDIIHGYFATTLKADANRVLYVDALHPIYAEWEYGLGKVSVLMTDLGNKKWTSSLFNDEDGISNSRLVKNILLAPIRNRVDSTGLEYTVLRDDEQIILSVSPNKSTALRDKFDDGLYFKEKIVAKVYVQERAGDANMWATVGHFYATESAGNNYTFTLPAEFTEMTYVILIQQIKTAWPDDNDSAPPAINYKDHGDDPLCDSISFAIVGQVQREYNVLTTDEEEKDEGVILLSSLVTNKKSSEVEDNNDDTNSANTRVFFTNYVKEYDRNTGKIEIKNSINSKRVSEFFERDILSNTENYEKTYNIDIPLIILALILFIVDLIFRNFVIKRRKKKVKEMTDEEQLESMRGR